MSGQIALLLVLASSPSFETDIKPIVSKRCTPCHTGQIPTLPNFLIYDTAFKKRQLIMKRVVEDKNMPPGNSTNMTDKERDIIKEWVDGGAKK